MVEDLYIVNFPKTQENREDIDIKLIDQLQDFLLDKNVVKKEENLNELRKCCNEFKSFLEDLKDKNDLETVITKEYKNQIFSEKQEYAHKFLEQIFISIDPYELTETHTEYFSLLKRFQETSSDYLKSYRDHLIHTLRVFLLVSAILEILGDTWIDILKNLLSDLLEKFDKDIKPATQLERLKDAELWIFSIQGVTLMSLFHDIGMVYSKHKEMIERINECIFLTSKGEDLSIFTWQPQLKKEYKDRIDNVLPIFEDLSEKYHPEYENLYKILAEELDSITLDLENIHGTLSLLLIFRLYYSLERVILETSPAKLEKEYKEATSRPELRRKKINTKDRIVADDEGEYSIKKLRNVIGFLILYEAMNAIFAHDKKGYVALSPFSEILVFADSSQEWDRFECKEGEPIKCAKDKIKICVNCCEGGETILSFYEETSFEETEILNKIISKLSDVLKDNEKRGAFGLFFHLKVECPNINPSRALFRCKYHPQIINDRDPGIRDEEIDIKDFCRRCKKKQRGG